MARDKIFEGSSAIEVTASRPEIWEWLRSAESALYWHGDCIDAYRIPESPEGVGEQHAHVTQRGTMIVTTIHQVVADVPYEALELSEVTKPGSSLRVDLLDQGPGTTIRLTVRTRSPKRSFRRWENPTPRLVQRAEGALERMKARFE